MEIVCVTLELKNSQLKLFFCLGVYQRAGDERQEEK